MTRVRVSGLRELEAALSGLTTAAGKGALRRAGKTALEPMARAARRLAPKDQNYLAESVDVGTKLTTRQARLHKKDAAVEVFMGPNNPAAVPQEFGTTSNAAQPFMRPAWDAGKSQLLDDVGFELAYEIDKAVERAARKAARNAR